MAVYTHAQSLDSLQEQEGVEWTDARSDVSQTFDARFDDEADVTEGVPKLHAVIGGRGLGEMGKPAIVPGELTAIHDHAADGGAMATHEFGHGVENDVGAMVDRSRD